MRKRSRIYFYINEDEIDDSEFHKILAKERLKRYIRRGISVMTIWFASGGFLYAIQHDNDPVIKIVCLIMYFINGCVLIEGD